MFERVWPFRQDEEEEEETPRPRRKSKSNEEEHEPPSGMIKRDLQIGLALLTMVCLLIIPRAFPNLLPKLASREPKSKSAFQSPASFVSAVERTDNKPGLGSSLPKNTSTISSAPKPSFAPASLPSIGSTPKSGVTSITPAKIDNVLDPNQKQKVDDLSNRLGVSLPTEETGRTAANRPEAPAAPSKGLSLPGSPAAPPAFNLNTPRNIANNPTNGKSATETKLTDELAPPPFKLGSGKPANETKEELSPPKPPITTTPIASKELVPPGMPASNGLSLPGTGKTNERVAKATQSKDASNTPPPTKSLAGQLPAPTKNSSASPPSNKDLANNGGVVVRSRELTKVPSGTGISKPQQGLAEQGSSRTPSSSPAAIRSGKPEPVHPFFQRYLDENAYFVRPGDTFESIAHAIFGDPAKGAELRRINQGAQSMASQPKPGDRIRLLR